MGFKPTTLLVLPSSPYMDDSLHLPLFPFGCNTNISSINSLSVPEKVLNTSDPLAFKSQLESCLGLYLKVVSKSTENSIFMGLTCFSILSTPCKHQSQESFDSVRVILWEKRKKIWCSTCATYFIKRTKNLLKTYRVAGFSWSFSDQWKWFHSWASYSKKWLLSEKSKFIALFLNT